MAGLLRRPVVWVPACAALLLALVWRTRLWEASSVLSSPDLVPLAIAVALNLVVLILWAIRSAGLLRVAGSPVGVAAIAPLTALANTLGNLTPGSSGELVRLWLLHSAHGVPYIRGGAVILIERFVAITYLGSSAAIVWMSWVFRLPGTEVVALLAAVAVAPAATYRAGVRPLSVLATVPLGRIVGAARWNRVSPSIRNLDETIAQVIANPRSATVMAVTSAGIFATYAAQAWLVAMSVRVSLDPILAWGALGLSIVVGVVSLLPFGLGAADLVFAALLGALGVPAPLAAAIAFGNRLVSTLPLGIAGVAGYAWCSARLPDDRALSAIEAAIGKPQPPGPGSPP